ncbi:MAG TPA: penicillin acylase family protein [Saprospiraceae bacterium]|nr:penicillin acylase family protein [Saprospiraceae bacterium]
MRLLCTLMLITTISFTWAQSGKDSFSPSEIQAWEARAKKVDIIRDNWGIPHVYAKTDADAVFGMLYAQCEDDFKRVERNYIDALGRMSLAYGPDYIWHDLRARLFMDDAEAKAYYEEAPKWMKKLCDAFADGINYYLHTHPEVKPDLLTRFEPWFPFTFSEGSIGGDITRVSLRGLEAFYGSDGDSYIDHKWSLEEEATGSNGFSIAPKLSETGNSLFLINPHTSFYFRSEQHINSEEGLQAYGAVTWGQFFIYQGFNENCGWMHTSTYADAIDQYEETIIEQEGRYYYLYGDTYRLVEEETVSIPYVDGNTRGERSFTMYFTHHGPVIRREGDKLITFRMMERPIDALEQSFLRTKATSYKRFRKTMKIRTNSSNNTVYADNQGNIAYWHGNFIPKRNPEYDYSGLIDGSNPETDWNGLHKIKNLIEVKNPDIGWIQNCNATPFTVAGPDSPERADYARYIAPDLENFRGVNAVRVLSSINSYNLDKLIGAMNNPYLAAFEDMIPALVDAYENSADKEDEDLAEAIGILGDWDFTYGENSVATALAVFWGERIYYGLAAGRRTAEDRANELMMDDIVLKHTSDQEKLDALIDAMQQIEADFGSWKTPWGEINRFQRLTGDIQESYDDDKPSLPVAYTSSRWGSLAAWGTESPGGVKRRYGRRGQSFVAAVDFGKDKVQARAIVSGGQNGDPESPHFTDQALKFTQGEFRDVYYYKSDVKANQEEMYKPGKR